MIAVKREGYAQALCAASLLAATLQMAVWFTWNGSLYMVSLIYIGYTTVEYICKVIFVKVETRMCNWMIAVKRESDAQALCAVSLLAAILQVAVWFMWNSSLYWLAFIYRLNQSKVYI